MGRKFTSAEVEVTARDRTKPGIDSAKKSMGGLTSAVKAYGAEIGAAVAAMYGVYRILKDVTSAYIEQEAAVQDMDKALRSTGVYTPTLSRELQNLAGELQGVTVYSDDAIESATGLLQAFGSLSGEGLKQAIPMMLDFAKATKTGPDEAAKIFGKTLGSNTNALSRYGLELKEGMTQLEKLGEIQAWVNSHFRDSSLIKSYADEFENINNLAGEYKETLGRFILEAGHPFTEWLREMLKEQAGMQEMANVIRLFGATTFAVFKLNSDIIQAFMGYVYATTQSLNILGTVAEKVLGGGLFSKGGRESIKKDLDDMGKMWTDYGKAVGDAFKTDIGKIIDGYSKAFTKYDGTIRTTGEGTKQLGDDTGRAADALTTGYFPALSSMTDMVVLYRGELAIASETQQDLTEATEGFFPAAQSMSDMVSTYRGELAGMNEETKIATEELTPLQQAFKDLQMTQEDMAAFTATTFRESMIDGFDAVMSGAKSLKEGLKDMIAGFLVALGRMYFSQFLWAVLFKPHKAAGMLAASVAAYAGAAIVRSLAKGGEFVTQGPELMMVGDNPSGRERVSVTPSEKGFSQQATVYLNITFGREIIKREIQALFDDGKLIVPAILIDRT